MDFLTIKYLYTELITFKIFELTDVGWYCFNILKIKAPLEKTSFIGLIINLNSFSIIIAEKSPNA